MYSLLKKSTLPKLKFFQLFFGSPKQLDMIAKYQATKTRKKLMKLEITEITNDLQELTVNQGSQTRGARQMRLCGPRTSQKLTKFGFLNKFSLFAKLFLVTYGPRKLFSV
jgi:hypothetical protein